MEHFFNLRPFVEIFSKPPPEWHPLVVHFPIVFLILEAALAALFVFTKKEEHARWGLYFLRLCVLSFLVVALAGFHDVGLESVGNEISAGFKACFKNVLSLDSTVMVHFRLNIILILLTSLKLVWREILGLRTLKGRWAIFYLTLTFLNLWIMIVTAYVGGSIDQR